MAQHIQSVHQRQSRPAVRQPARLARKAGTAPVNVNYTVKRSNPTLTAVPGGTRVVNSEVSTLSFAAASATAATTVRINPTAGDMPWLEGTALNYDKIKYNSVTLEYVPLVPTSEGGDVVIFFDPDSNDTAPATYTAAYNAGGAKSFALYAKGSVSATSADLSAQKEYTTSEAATPNLLFGPGNFQVFATRSGATTAAMTFGRIFLHYNVTLTKPESPSTTALAKHLVAPVRRPEVWDVFGSPDFWKDGTVVSDGPSALQVQNILGALQQAKPTNYTTAFLDMYGDPSKVDDWQALGLSGNAGAGNCAFAAQGFAALYTDGTVLGAAPTSEVESVCAAIMAAYKTDLITL